MNSPFKFLDAYDPGESDVFFGRKEEINQLYDLIFKSPLVLVYGLSGTGKTSLVQCGLSSKFDGPDWFPFFIRRKSNFIASMNEELESVFPNDEEFKPDDTKANITALFEEYLRPVYLIFDQFEELFLLGDEEEQQAFAQKILSLLAQPLPCKVILIIREEFLGQLYYLEKVLPGIYDFRMRVEPMGLKKVSEVLSGSFSAFNVKLDRPEELIPKIYDKLSESKSGIELPYLQVYLDGLYKKAIPTATSLKKDDLPEVEITEKEIEDQGEIANFLNQFLIDQKEEVKVLLNQETYSEAGNFIDLFLDNFVTEEGTKRPVYFEKEENDFRLENRAIQFLPKNSQHFINLAMEELGKRRILRMYDNYAELAHDVLARLIDQGRGDYQRRLNFYFNRIVNAHRAFPETKEYLSPSQLAFMQPVFEDLQVRLDQPLIDFFQESEAAAEAAQKAELAAERRKRKIAFIVGASGIALAAIAAVGLVFALFYGEKYRKEAFISNLTAGQVEVDERNFTGADSLLNLALEKANSEEEREEVALLRQGWDSIEIFLGKSDTARKSGQLLLAKQYLDTIYLLNQDNEVLRDIAELEKDIKQEIDYLISEVNSLINLAKNPQLRSEREKNLTEALNRCERIIDLDPTNTDVPKKKLEIQELINN